MRVQVYATLRELLGVTELSVDVEGGATARDVLRRLATDYPALERKLWDQHEQLSGLVTVLLNGRLLAFLNGLDTPVGPDDNLKLFPPVGGG